MGLLSVLFYQRPLFVHRPVGPLDATLEEKFADCNIKNKSSIPVDLSFERIINNGPMPPASLRDFMNYLIYVAHDAENLQFYLWLRSYKAKFERLRQYEKTMSPPWLSETPQVEQPKSPPPMPSPDISDANSPRKMLSIETMRFSEESSIQWKTMEEAVEEANMQAGLMWQPFDCQPFREEVMRVTANYIVPGGPRELNLSQKDREQVLRALQHTTHPSAFDAAAHVVEVTLRGQSHPNFVRWVIGNGTRPHTIFGRALGAIVTLLGIAAAIALTLSSAPRWYRLLALPVFALGLIFVIGTRSGLCPLLYVLGHARELQPWEARPIHSSSSGFASKIMIFSSAKSRSDEESTIASSTALSDFEKMSRSSYARAMDPLGSNNDFSAEPWVDPYRERFFWMKFFSKTQRTQNKQVRLIRDQIFYQCLAWALIVSPLFAVLFLVVPSGNLY